LLALPETHTIRPAFPEAFGPGRGTGVSDEHLERSTLALTLREAAGVCRVRRGVIRRAHADGRFLHSFKDPDGTWRVPVDDLVRAGFRPYLVGNGTARSSRDQIDSLRREIAILRERLRASEQVALERERHVEDLRAAISLIPPPPATLPSPPASIPAMAGAPALVLDAPAPEADTGVVVLPTEPSDELWSERDTEPEEAPPAAPEPPEPPTSGDGSRASMAAAGIWLYEETEPEGPVHAPVVGGDPFGETSPPPPRRGPGAHARREDEEEGSDWLFRRGRRDR
jgi:hypothetical protein